MNQLRQTVGNDVLVTANFSKSEKISPSSILKSGRSARHVPSTAGVSMRVPTLGHSESDDDPNLVRGSNKATATRIESTVRPPWPVHPHKLEPRGSEAPKRKERTLALQVVSIASSPSVAARREAVAGVVDSPKGVDSSTM